MEQHTQLVNAASQPESSSLPSPELAQSALPTIPERREKLQLFWGDLLQAAVREPGLILDAYSRFHGYSLGNRLAALVQCHARGLEPGPIHTSGGWRKLGYQVRSGEKALWLCMPLTRQVRDDGTPPDGTTEKHRNGKTHTAAKRGNGSEPKPDGEKATIEVISAFVWKPHWFVLAQTAPLPGQEPPPIENPPLEAWHKARALAALGIAEIPFDLLDGNCQGFAKERSIAVSPLAVLPYKTLFHEMAHVVLGHTRQEGNGTLGGLLIVEAELPDPQPRHIREAEAEATALLLLATLDLPGQEYCRGYIQSWLNRDGNGEGINEASARRIFGAADRILRAGLNAGREDGEGDEFPNGAPVPTPLPPTAPVWAQAAEAPSAPALSTQSQAQPALQFEQMPAAASAGAPARAWMPGMSEANGHGTNSYGTNGYSAVPQFSGLIQSQPSTPPIEFAAATLPRPPTRQPVEAFSLDGELDLFQLLMGLHETGGDLNPLNGPHPDVKRALSYVQAKDPQQAPALLYWLHTAALALEAAAQIANEAISWRAIEEFYNPQELPAPTLLPAQGEAPAALNGGFGGEPFVDTPQGWLPPPAEPSPAIGQTSENPDQEPEHANGTVAVNGTATLNGKPSSARAEASARRTVGRAFRSELERERRRFFAIAEKHDLPTGRDSAKAIRDAISTLLEIPVKTRADLTARQWGLAGAAIETGDLKW